jgi:hypothetical protein
VWHCWPYSCSIVQAWSEAPSLSFFRAVDGRRSDLYVVANSIAGNLLAWRRSTIKKIYRQSKTKTKELRKTKVKVF